LSGDENIDIQKICHIARVAGKAILEIYETDFDVTIKGDNSPLTSADKAAHEIIDGRLRELYRDIPCLSEEGKLLSYEDRLGWNRFWLVDPLDGTKEFIKRNGEFTVNIALIDGHTPVLGVIYVPVKNTMYFASKGDGAWKQSGSDNPEKIRVKSYQKSEGLIAMQSRSHLSKEHEEFISKLKMNDSISAGSSLKFCAVAEGRADIYPCLHPTWEWDTAAGQCIVEEAGGQVVDDTWNPIKYNKQLPKNGSFLALGDPLIFEELKGMTLTNS
jgi:3'(2'), 5'-bisphosphate nucleotidase